MTTGILRRGSRSRRAIAAALVALALAIALGACDSGGAGGPRGPAGSPGMRAARTPAPRSFLEQLIPPPGGFLPAARVPGEIRQQVAALPLERKVAQLLLVGFDGTDASAPFLGTLRRMDLGGVVVQRRNYTGRSALAALTAAIGKAAGGRDHEPPLLVAPQEGGDVSAFPDLPPSAAPGDLSGVAAATAEAARTARTLKKLGLNGVLAPDADVGTDSDPLGTRAFSDSPRQVSQYAAGVVAAYRRYRMLSAPSHFPGIGGAAQSTDVGPTGVGLDMRQLGRRDLVPFRAAIQAGAPAIVVGHAAYAPDSFVVPGSLSHAIETDLLRARLGFRGIAITDDLEAGAIVAGNRIDAAAVQAVRAGADMVWISGPQADWMAAYDALLRAVTSRRIPLARLNSAVTRIVTVKRELGLRAPGGK